MSMWDIHIRNYNDLTFNSMPHIICTVSNDLSYDQRMQRICRSLSGAGYDVTLVGRQKPASPALRPETYRQVRLPCRHGKGKLFYLEYNWLLLKFLLAEPFDIVCAVELDTLLPAFLAGRHRGKTLRPPRLRPPQHSGQGPGSARREKGTTSGHPLPGRPQ